MSAIDSIRHGADGAVRLGRGLADRAIRVTAPPISRTVSRLLARVPTRRTPPPPAHGTTTFTPAPAEVHPDRAPKSAPEDSHPVSPSTVARNIAPQRPVAKAPAKRPVKKSVPGAKLPPPRPSTS